MNKKYFLWGGVLLALILVLGVIFPRPGPSIIERVVEKMVVGAFSGPDISSDYLIFNGIEKRYFSSRLNQASTTICMFKTPAATSTLVFGSVKIVGATTTAIGIEIGKDVSPTATTTSLGYTNLASNAQMVLIASTTPGSFGAGTAVDGKDDAYVFAPNNYFNVKYGGAAGDLNVLTGSCKAEFIVN